MTTSRQEMRTAVVALLALALARCSEQAGPTGWIPSNGAISGVIALASPPGPPGIARIAPRMAASSRSVRPARGSRAEFTPNDLIVTFRHDALGAPPVGTAALA